MLYPRRTYDGQLVTEEQMVGPMEHLSREHRIIWLDGEIQNIRDALNLLYAFDSISHQPIKIMINSPGGDAYESFQLYDAWRLEIHNEQSRS